MKSSISSEWSSICLKSNDVRNEEFLIHLSTIYKQKLRRMIMNQSNSNLFRWPYKQSTNKTKTLKITSSNPLTMLRAKHILETRKMLFSSNWAKLFRIHNEKRWDMYEPL